MLTKENINIMCGVEHLSADVENFDKNAEIVTYHVKNTPICAWDQHSRARIGVSFFNYKVDNNPNYVVYTNVYNLLSKDEKFRNKTFDTLSKLEQLRNKAKNKISFNLMTRNCSYSVRQDWNSLVGQMSRRLKFCEEEFITGLHFLLRDKLIKIGIEKANNLLPGCDKLGYCDYSSSDYLSNLFGCLFASCNRQKSEKNYATFNESCSNVTELEKQLNIIIPKSLYEIENNIR